MGDAYIRFRSRDGRFIEGGDFGMLLPHDSKYKVEIKLGNKTDRIVTDLSKDGVARISTYLHLRSAANKRERTSLKALIWGNGLYDSKLYGFMEVAA